MNKFRTFLFIVLVILSINLCLFLQLLIGAQTTLLNPNYYRNLMEKHDIYELPQNFVLLSIKNNSNTDLLSEPVYKALFPAINTAFSIDWAKYQSDKLIVSLIEYFKGNQKNISLEIPIIDRKVILKSEITNYLEKKYSSEELAAFKIYSAENTADLIVSSINLPDSFNIVKILEISEMNNYPLVHNFRAYYKIIAYLPFILFFIFIFSLIFIGKNGLGLKWAGYSILLAGFIATLFTSAYLVFLDDVILVTNISKQNDLLMSIGTNPLLLVSIVKNSVIETFNKITLVCCALGIVSIIAGSLWQRRTINS